MGRSCFLLYRGLTQPRYRHSVLLAVCCAVEMEEPGPEAAREDVSTGVSEELRLPSSTLLLGAINAERNTSNPHCCIRKYFTSKTAGCCLVLIYPREPCLHEYCFCT